MAQMQVHTEPSELSFRNDTCLPKASGTADTTSTHFASGRCEKYLARYNLQGTLRQICQTKTIALQITRMAFPSGRIEWFGKSKGPLRDGLATCR